MEIQMLYSYDSVRCFTIGFQMLFLSHLICKNYDKICERIKRMSNLTTLIIHLEKPIQLLYTWTCFATTPEKHKTPWFFQLNCCRYSRLFCYCARNKYNVKKTKSILFFTLNCIFGFESSALVHFGDVFLFCTIYE